MYMNVIDVERAASFANDLTGQAPLAAAAVGAVVAELSLVHRPRGTRSATLTARRWSDDIHGVWLATIAGCLVVSLLAALLPRSQAGPEWVWLGTAASCMAILAATVGVHIVVNRPAISGDDDRARLDDALRADGAHHVVGAAVALAGVATCASLSGVVGGWLGVIPFLLTYFVLGNW
ncbi:MAG: hypothetical protein HKN44_01460 [Ilumatobacter sp.]|nr:hypothetical protein [Ilumatobacter sp.]